MRPPKHKPEGKMQNHHYAAIFASYMHCEHTCRRGLEHKEEAHHEIHAELEKYPNKKRIAELLDGILADFLHHEANIPPHYRSAFCHAHQIAKTFLK
jgi:hypothetical protein